MNFEREFEQNINQLVHLLKKIIKNLPGQGTGFGQFPGNSKDGNVQLNLCFFNFIPMTPEDMEELEEAYEEALSQEERKGEEVSGELSADDIEFLKKHGIRY